MAKKQKPETEASETAPAESAGPAAQPTGEARGIEVDDSSVSAGYANFCRVSSTPEELILDLGLNPNPYATEGATVKVSQRIIMNHYTAKRLLSAVSLAVQRYEKAFGVLETDVRKRVQPGAGQQQS